MLSIYLCDDNAAQLNRYQTIIENLILIEEYDMQVQAAVTNPQELLELLSARQAANQLSADFYLLDIELHSDIDGFQLAQQIRKLDSRGFIVFITTHSEMAMLTFRYQIEAMDFILKDESWNIGPRIHSCLKAALERHNHSADIAMLSFKMGSHTVQIEQDSILYITASQIPHKILIVTRNGTKELYGTLSKCMSSLTEQFIRCHKAFIVNIRHIQDIDRNTLTLHLTGGQTCIASTRGIQSVIQAMNTLS